MDSGCLDPFSRNDDRVFVDLQGRNWNPLSLYAYLDGTSCHGLILLPSARSAGLDRTIALFFPSYLDKEACSGGRGWTRGPCSASWANMESMILAVKRISRYGMGGGVRSRMER